MCMLSYPFVRHDDHWNGFVVILFSDYFTAKFFQVMPACKRINCKHYEKRISLRHGGISEEHELFLAGSVNDFHVVVMKAVLNLGDVAFLCTYELL